MWSKVCDLWFAEHSSSAKWLSYSLYPMWPMGNLVAGKAAFCSAGCGVSVNRVRNKSIPSTPVNSTILTNPANQAAQTQHQHKPNSPTLTQPAEPTQPTNSTQPTRPTEPIVNYPNPLIQQKVIASDVYLQSNISRFCIISSQPQITKYVIK